MESVKSPVAETAEPAGTFFRAGSDPLFSGACGGELRRVQKLSGSGRVQPPAIGGDGHDYPARRVFDVIYAVSGGDFAGDAAGDFRVSDADVSADGAGSGERVDV